MSRIAKALAVSAAAGFAVASAAGIAAADAGATGSTAGSPGLLSGNAVQAPIHVPAAACGNTASVVGLLNTASGATCGNS